MHCFRKSILIFLLLAGCCVAPASAQNVNMDSVMQTIADTPVSLEHLNESPALSPAPVAEDSAEPRREVVYNTSKPDASQWQQATSNDAYGYRDKKEFVETREEAPESDPAWLRVLIRFFRFLQSGTGQIILWSFFVLIIGYIAYRIIIGQGSGLFGRRDRKKSKDEPTGDITEEGLLGSDWEGKLRAALAAGDTRLAIRFSYMHLLQSLQQRGLIVYRADKTNTAYYYELSDSLRPSFRNISRQYEYAWYGRFLPAKPAMDAYMQTYEGLKKSITYA